MIYSDDMTDNRISAEAIGAEVKMLIHVEVNKGTLEVESIFSKGWKQGNHRASLQHIGWLAESAFSYAGKVIDKRE